jgi:hypothetical protein
MMGIDGGDGLDIFIAAGTDGGHSETPGNAKLLKKVARAIIVGFSACRWPGGHVACLDAGRTLWANLFGFAAPPEG